MAYEMITVKMNRNNTSVPWGFTITGPDLHIGSITKGSVADRAGLDMNDAIIELSGRPTQALPLHQANQIIDSALEIRMIIKRYVTSHMRLPWQLTEHDNKIVVDQIRPTTYTNRYSLHKEIHSNESRVIGGSEQPPFTNLTNTRSNFSDSEGKQYQMVSTKATGNRDSEKRSANYQHVDSNVYRVPIGGVDYNVIGNVTDSYQQSKAAAITPVFTTERTPNSERKIHPVTDKSDLPHVPFYHSPRTVRSVSPTATVKHLHFHESPVHTYGFHQQEQQQQQQPRQQQHTAATTITSGQEHETQPQITTGVNASHQYSVSPHSTGIVRSESAHVHHPIPDEPITAGTAARFHEKSPSAQSASFKRIARAVGALDQ